MSTVGTRLRGAPRVLRDPGVGVTLLIALVAGLVPLLDLGDDVFKLRVLWGVQLPLDLLLGVFCLRAARVTGVDRIVRSYMLTLAGTSIAFTIGDSYQFVRSLWWPVVADINGGLVPTITYLGGLLLVVFRMLSHKSPGGSRGERLRFHLDALTVLLGGGVLAWCFSFNPRSVAGLELVSALVAASVLLLAAFAAVKMVLSGTAPMTKGGSIPMIAAAGLLALTTALPIVDDDGIHPILMALRILAAALFAVGPRVQELQTLVKPDFRRERRHRPYNVLPYLAVAATLATFLIVMPDDLGYRAWGGVVGVIAVTAIVVIRQLLAFLDNFDLINRLDATLLDLRGHQAMLHEQATRDGLTRLANRTAFAEAVGADLADPRAVARGLAVLLIDLDDFKAVNDTLGHGVGDGLLTTVADRLRNAVRAKDLVSRLGGDEFAVLLRGVSEAEAAAMADRILADVVQPARVDGHMLVVKASIGVAPATPGDDPEGLMRNADIAMYAAKDAGKGGIQQYAADMGARILETVELGTRLREAVGTDQFSLVYQPVVDLPSGTVLGAEALVRWQPPGRPEIPPADFIPTAESTGEIVPLGRWILREACRQLAQWRRDHDAARDVTMAVNVAGRQLQTPGFVDEVAALLAEFAIPPDRLVIEITESAMLDEPVVLAALHGLRGLGLDLALDDFGTAASSLGLLLTCPMSGLKLDRSFVERLGIDSRPTAVATAVSQIARALDLTTVAEGVESPEQARLLSDLGYRRAQGFLYSPPLEPAAFAAGWKITSTV
ncbi:putative bifunctional diguanylate cyclase/phosphodiesterase [Actinoplanes sp. NPDC049265]|uniref:putative bifunctional diguanylate cyclase/phosphodiesterase n=1 Tax=Actinoplanes sp. NPDC049265 TaxID=3363902 RepID=UPI00371930CC